MKTILIQVAEMFPLKRRGRNYMKKSIFSRLLRQYFQAHHQTVKLASYQTPILKKAHQNCTYQNVRGFEVTVLFPCLRWTDSSFSGRKNWHSTEDSFLYHSKIGSKY